MKKAHWIAPAVSGLALLGAASALAGPLAGKTYNGQTASRGTNEKNRQLLIHPGPTPISLKVSRSGRSVTIRFPTHSALFYCVTAEKLSGTPTATGSISSSGRFHVTVGERFSPAPGPPPITESVSGKFSGSSVSGTIRTVAPPCGGTTTFSAKG